MLMVMVTAVRMTVVMMTVMMMMVVMINSGDNDDEVSFFALLLHRCI